MAPSKRLAVVAIGGNSLIQDKDHLSIPSQYEAAALTAHHIADMIESGWNVVVTHGNGPQMGFILRRSELSIHEVSPVPMDYAGADLQGAIGYMFVKAFRNEFRRRGMRREPVAVVTETLVDRNDPAFANPTKADRVAYGRGQGQRPGGRAGLGGQGRRRPRLAQSRAVADPAGDHRLQGDRALGARRFRGHRLRRRRHSSHPE